MSAYSILGFKEKEMEGGPSSNKKENEVFSLKGNKRGRFEYVE